MVTNYFLLFFIPYAYAASLSFNLTDIGPKNLNRDILVDDDAYISINGVQVTPDEIGDRTGKAGRATYIQPLHLWNNATGGGAMGLPINTSTILAMNRFVAVEFDTYENNWDPRDFYNNSIGNHVGITISNLTGVSLTSVRFKKWLSNITSVADCQAWITYDSISKNLSVSFTGFQNNSIVRQDGLYYTIDLRDVLTEWVIFGFSAATGASFQKNNVKSWNFSSTDVQTDEISSLPPNPDPDQLPLNLDPDQLPLNPGPDPPPLNPGSDPVDNKKSNVVLIVGLSVAITFLAVTTFVLWRKKQKNREDEAEELEFNAKMNIEFETGNGPTRFSYHELAQSTSNFAEDEKLGEGGFGGVYRGFLKDSRTYVAVKRVSKTSKQGIKEYASEVRIISRLRHRNLVQLIGWCHEKRELLLVYELMENGSLDSHLFKAKSLLTWGTRYKIAHGLASALLYLHEEWEQCVLHRDIKSSNVMLDSNFSPKLGDFGLAKLVDHEKGSQTTMLAGTLGYMAPECVVTGKASKESDVFSFGVVALEIACGRKPIEYKAQERKIRLVEWVWELYGAGTLSEAADPRLGSDFKEEEMKRMMIVGLWCAHPDSDIRPSIRQAIQVLNSEASLPILPSKMPVASYLSLPVSSSHGVASIIQNQSSSSIDNIDSSKQNATSSTAFSSTSMSLLHSTQ